MYEMIRDNLNIKEETEEEIRDLYKTHRILHEGDYVESLVNGLEGIVHRRGANHLICVTENGVMWRSFLTDINF